MTGGNKVGPKVLEILDQPSMHNGTAIIWPEPRYLNAWQQRGWLTTEDNQLSG